MIHRYENMSCELEKEVMRLNDSLKFEQGIENNSNIIKPDISNLSKLNNFNNLSLSQSSNDDSMLNKKDYIVKHSRKGSLQSFGKKEKNEKNDLNYFSNHSKSDSKLKEELYILEPKANDVPTRSSLTFSYKGFNNFKIDYEIDRKYNFTNMETGRNFFKYRYISENLRTNTNKSYQNFENYYEVSESILETKNQKNSFIINHAPDDKNIIKLNKIYIQKLEKSIFLFNLRKYENSFNFLKENNITKSEEEFAEVLLIIPGFDRDILGEFLSNTKFPNQNYKILTNLVDKINLENASVLDAFRFFLSRINLPKDANLIMIIIEIFSCEFYSLNKSYNSSSNVYLLLSTILALNTFLSRRDIKHINSIKKEDFLKWNSDLDRNLVEGIYEELKENKLDLKFDENQIYYSRLTKMLFFDKELNKIDDENLIKSHLEELDHLNGLNFVEMLKKGQIFLKYGKFGQPHLRFVKLSNDETNFIWTKPNMCGKFIDKIFPKSKKIEVMSLVEVYIGTTSKVFERYKIPPIFDLGCLSIQSFYRTLDLRTDNEEICNNWYKGIKFLINKNRIMRSIVKISHDNISNIWKNEILLNWKIYRKLFELGINFKFSGENHIFRKKTAELAEKINKYNCNNILDEKISNDFICLYSTLGIPNWLRQKLWSILIGNPLNITELLYDKFVKKMERVHFVYNTVNNNYEGMIMLDNPHNNDIITLLKDILSDVSKCFSKFKLLIKNEEIKYKEVNFKENLYKMLRVFTLQRPDITYTEQLSYLASLFLINNDDHYNAYSMFINFTLNQKYDFVFKFLIKDEIFIKSKFDNFDSLFKMNLNKLWKHFRNLDVSINLFFYSWFEFCFIKCFLSSLDEYEFFLKLFDTFLIRGEVYLIEIGLCLLKIQEKDLLNVKIIYLF